MAKRTNGKPTTRAEYDKLYKRLEKRVKELEKRNYIFPSTFLPQKPKNPTAQSVKSLQKKLDNIYKKAEYMREDGKVVTGKRGREIEREIAGQKAARTRKANINNRRDTYFPKVTDIVLRNVEELIYDWEPSTHWAEAFVLKKSADRATIMSYLRTEISMSGRYVVARRLEESSEDVIDIVQNVLYSSNDDGVHMNLTAFASIIRGRALTQEESAELTELMESYNEGV